MNFNNNDKITYSTGDIQRYLNGEMSAKEMHALEKAAMDDPFLTDAIEGYNENQIRGKTGRSGDLQELQQRLKSRLDAPHKKRVIALSNTYWLKIAALVLLIAGSGTLAYYYTNNSQSNESLIVKGETPKQKSSANDSLTNTNSGRIDSTAVVLNEPISRSQQLRSAEKNEILDKSLSPASRLKTSPTAPASAPLASASKPQPLSDVESSLASLSKSEDVTGRRMATESIPIVIGYGTERKEKNFSAKVVQGNKQPVPDVTVTALSGSKKLDVKTDSNGYFKFTAPDTTAFVVIMKEGFEPAQRLIGNSTVSEIILKSVSQNNEKPVASSSEKAIDESASNILKKRENAAPVIGLPAFEQYLASNKKIPPDSVTIHGNVVVSFDVNEDGTIDNFIILKSLSKQIDNEAIRLIKEGPKWKVLHNQKAAATVTIKF